MEDKLQENLHGKLASRDQLIEHIKAGRAVIFPTDTVYGLGVSPLYCPSPQVLFDLKKRPAGKSVAWLVSGIQDLEMYGKNIPAYAYELAEAYWPGALTLIVQASEKVPATYVSADGSIGMRMPASKEACELMAAAKSPLATSSANISGDQAVGELSQLDPALSSKVPVLDTQEKPGEGIASTVVSCLGSQPLLLREGSLSQEELQLFCQKHGTVLQSNKNSVG